MGDRVGIGGGVREPLSRRVRRVVVACAVCVVAVGSAGAQSGSAETVSTVIPVGNNAQGLAYDAGKGEVFVANAGDGTVSVISDASNSVVATIPVSGAYGPEGVAYDAGKGEVFVADGRSAQAVSVISDATDTVIATVPIPGVPTDIAYDAGRDEVFVGDGGSTVYVISDATNAVVGTVTVGSGTTSLAYDSGKGEIFSANADGTVSVISDATNTVVATVAAMGYGAAAYDPATGEVFVANGWPGSITDPGTVSVISDATNTVVATVTVGNTAQGAAYDAGTGEVFVGNHYSNSVSAISDTTDAVTATVGGVGGPTGVAYDSGKGEIFVGNSNFNSVTVIADGSPPLNDDAVGGIHDIVHADVSAVTDSVASGTSLVGLRKWDVGMGELDGGTLTNPTISVASGYQPSQLGILDSDPSEPVTSVPIVQSNPGGSGVGFEIDPTIAASVQPRCDASRSVSPLQVPVTGGRQTVTLTVRCTDPEVTSIEDGVFLSSGNGAPVVTLESFSPPSNLDQGEQLCLSGCPNGGGGGLKPGIAGVGFELDHIVTGKQYTFTVVFDSQNPFGMPFAQKPGVSSIDTSSSSPCFACGPQSSITFADPSLDGPTPGAGQVTFSAGEPHGWDIFRNDDREIDLDGTQSSPLYYEGSVSGADGQAVTLTAYWSGGGGLSGTPVTFALGSQSCVGSTGSATAPSGDIGATCTITLRQPVGTYTLSISSPGDESAYPSTTSASFSITGPTSADQCKNGGWRIFGIFKNQGDCVSYVATGGKNPPSGP